MRLRNVGTIRPVFSSRWKPGCLVDGQLNAHANLQLGVSHYLIMMWVWRSVRCVVMWRLQDR